MALVNAEKVQVQSNYSNKYEELISDLGKLTATTAVLYPIPRGVKYEKFYDRIASILEYRKVKAPEGFMFSRARSKDGKSVVITLRPRHGSNGQVKKQLKGILKNVRKAKVKIKAKKRLTKKNRVKAIVKMTKLKPGAVELAEKMAGKVQAKAAHRKKLKAERDARYRAKKKAESKAGAGLSEQVKAANE